MEAHTQEKNQRLNFGLNLAEKQEKKTQAQKLLGFFFANKILTHRTVLHYLLDFLLFVPVLSVLGVVHLQVVRQLVVVQVVEGEVDLGKVPYMCVCVRQRFSTYGSRSQGGWQSFLK